jgi:predicted O-linked N-acetylglucosamine transferase (SPINDLY family)
LNPQLQQALDLLNANQNDAAKAILRRLVQRNPRDVDANRLLGMLHAGVNEHDQALIYLSRAAALAPHESILHFMHANVLLILKKDKDAAAAYRNVIRLAPDKFHGYDGLARVLLRMGKYDEGIAAYEQGVAATPDDPASYRAYAQALSTLGRVNEGRAILHRGLARLPADPGLLESLCYESNFADDLDRRQVFEEHQSLGLAVAARSPFPPVTLPNSRDPERPLRIGFVSGDFCYHACALFMEGLITHLDRDRYQPYCYSLRAHTDEVTARFQQKSAWRFSQVPDAQFREQVLADQIDVLIDAAGWTEHQKLAAFVPRLAPLQMTWLGYPNTTGLPTMDYRIVDAITDPPGAEQFCTEKLLRLPGCFLTFQPIEFSPSPKLSASLAAIAAGARTGPDYPLTFGSFNRLSKVRPQVVRTWARLLARVPHARLFLKSSLVSDDVKAGYNSIFEAEGVPADRILWSGYLPSLEHHLSAYHHVDIALDSFPYNGTTTSCEAVWMGVPVIALAGDVHRARVGASLLTALGLPELIAQSESEYVGLAAALANDPPRLLKYHEALRPQMAASPLCDSRAYARNFESVLRQAWREWCSA